MTNNEQMKQISASFPNIALPVGEILHEQLKTAYVDFSELLNDLASDSFTGYVDFDADNCNGIVLFQNGTVIDAFYAEPGRADLGEIAIAEMYAVALEKRGVLDVVRTSSELTFCCAALIHGQPVHTDLDAQAIRLDGLLKSLEENRFTGSVVIRKADDGGEGFDLLFEGKSLGTFCRTNGMLVPDQARLAQLAAERGAVISVISTPSFSGPINLMKVLAARPHARLLTEAVRRCFYALAELAGSSTVADYFQSARDEAMSAYPWLKSLKIESNGKSSSAELDLTGIPLDEAIKGIVMVLKDCRDRGIGLFGEKAIRSNIEKQLREIRPQLTAIGFDEKWL